MWCAVCTAQLKHAKVVYESPKPSSKRGSMSFCKHPPTSAQGRWDGQCPSDGAACSSRMAVAVRSCAGQSAGLFAGVGRRPDGFRSAYSTSAREFRDSWRAKLANSTAVTFGFSIHGSGCRMAGPTECTTTTVFGTALIKLSSLSRSVVFCRPRSLPSTVTYRSPECVFSNTRATSCAICAPEVRVVQEPRDARLVLPRAVGSRRAGSRELVAREPQPIASVPSSPALTAYPFGPREAGIVTWTTD